MESTRLKEIADHAEVLFKPETIALGHKFAEDLLQARYKAMQTHNAAALFPAEAECYIANAKALVVAKATCMAAAYTAFHEAAGREADAYLSTFFSHVVNGRKQSFESEALLTCRRTNTSGSQIPFLTRGFEGKAHVALLEGRRILDIQRVQMRNRPPQPAPLYSYSAIGPNSRIIINGTDNSTNQAVVARDE